MPLPLSLDHRRPRITGVSARSSLRAALALLLVMCAAQPALATSVVPPEFSELVNESSYIVRAVVKSVTAEERTNARGFRKIYSRVELEVKEVVAGRPPSPLVLEVLGGRVGDRELAIDGAPKFVVGEESILFVQNNGRQVYPLVRMMHGMYRIEREPTRGRPQVVRSDGQPLRDVRDVSAPLHGSAARTAGDTANPGLSPEDFIRKIRAAVTKPELLEN